ncbi:response regulator [Paenibacillus pinihumi]|uniref:response regulator n=1 Tax=Paenibacillus pinihumi TaxID=669462 RepID=UPI0003F9F36A|nr:response regulator [Paenibacillus pinihumi]
MATLLIVEDEEAIAELIAMNLRLVGHAAYQIHNGSEVMTAIGERDFDLIILDVMLPGQDGIDLMHSIAPRGI